MSTLSELTLGVFSDDPYAALDAEIELSEHPHPRARIRHWVHQRLRAAAEIPAKVEMNRPTTMALRKAPCVLVYLLSEEAPVERDQSDLRYEHTFTLGISSLVTLNQIPEGATIDDVGDAFAHVFGAVLLNDRDDDGVFFGAQASACDQGRTVLDFEPDGERVLLHVLNEFAVSYQTTPGRPPLGPLELIHADWDLAPPDEQIEATDEIDTTP